MTTRLKSLVIENFRSLKGRVVVPLDAQVVLVHGTNGMGKTSVLSALELALTGKIAHLAADGDNYQRFLTNLESVEGSITLTTTNAIVGATEGHLSFGHAKFAASPLLSSDYARFFAERCYLPQATLGRLLEIYDDQRPGSNSPLTQFVKELLGLDPLDALVDGLDPAFHVARIRRLAPEFRGMEELRTTLQAQISKNRQAIGTAVAASEERRKSLNEILTKIAGNTPLPPIVDGTDLARLKSSLRASHEQDHQLADTTRIRADLRGLLERWKALPAHDPNRDQAAQERAAQQATQAFDSWREASGSALAIVIETARADFSDLPSLEYDPEKCRSEALQKATAENARCTALIKAHTAATERVNSLNTVIGRATNRIEELNRDLAVAAQDAKTLANALAGVVPHIHGESCPVCDRDFREREAGPLSAHIAAKIATLTSEAGRLQALANERADQSALLANAQREILSAGSGQLSSEDLADMTVREVQMAGISRQLLELAPIANEGSRLLAGAVAARQTLLRSQRRDELTHSILPEIEKLIQQVLGKMTSDYETVDESLLVALQENESAHDTAQKVGALRIDALAALDLHERELESIRTIRTENDEKSKRLDELAEAIKAVDGLRMQAKQVANTANDARSKIVSKVFNESLNKIWRDLFVRLAPSEQFVPAFKLPQGADGKVEAILETLHRTGKTSGSPGAMLSQGNLNTAALTLFLALHLSVPVKMPWLILDDPVQSMDDVHIAQFAALLRTLAKSLNRQVVIAVHERALFDYLALELSPAFEGDSLITVEITRSFRGDAIVKPLAFGFQEDHAIGLAA